MWYWLHARPNIALMLWLQWKLCKLVSLITTHVTNSNTAYEADSSSYNGTKSLRWKMSDLGWSSEIKFHCQGWRRTLKSQDSQVETELYSMCGWLDVRGGFVWVCLTAAMLNQLPSFLTQSCKWLPARTGNPCDLTSSTCRHTLTHTHLTSTIF